MSDVTDGLALAAIGFNIFPLKPNAKTPAIESWQVRATGNELQIRRWAKAFPGCNWGIPTGAQNEHLVVIDVDPRNGGHETFRQLRAVEDFPSTLGVQTQGGGLHLYYRATSALKGRKDALGPGVDVKSAGGYVVGPGSTIDGRSYQWFKPGKTVAPCPQWIVERCSKAGTRSEAAGKRLVQEDDSAVALAENYIETAAPEAHEGNHGDDTAFRVAARLYDFGVSGNTALALMHEWNQTKAFPPFDQMDLERIVGSAGKNRNRAIGIAHPENASGFEPVTIEARVVAVVPPPVEPDNEDDLESLKDAAGRALALGVEPLIKGVIDRNTLSVWFGPPKSGKTFAALDACASVAAGALWAGIKTHQGAGLYLALEGGRGIYKRLRALQLVRGAELGEDPPLFVRRKPLDLLRNKAHVELVLRMVDQITKKTGQQVELIVVDTLARALAGGDENSPTDMGGLIKNLDLIRASTGAHVMGIHHTGKDRSKGARGHSNLLGALDTEIRIQDGEITSTAQRDLEDDLHLSIKLRTVNIGTDASGNHVTSCVAQIKTFEASDFVVKLAPEWQERYDKIISQVGFEPFSASEYAEKGFGIRSTVEYWLAKLAEMGSAQKLKRGQWVMINAENAENAENQ
jgi:hypothetical protein